MVICDHLLREGYDALDQKYNCIAWFNVPEMRIENGRIFVNDELVPIVHNTGGDDRARPIARFGFGPDCNRIKFWVGGAIHFARRHNIRQFG